LITSYRSVISGFRRAVDEICALLGCCAPSIGSSVSTFRDNLSVRSSRVKTSKTSWPLKMGPIGTPETSVKDYHSTLPNIPEQCRSQFTDCPSKHSSWHSASRVAKLLRRSRSRFASLDFLLKGEMSDAL
jgi:hypothetical protein